MPPTPAATPPGACATKRGFSARLEHPGIVPVHDAGTLADGRVYLRHEARARRAASTPRSAPTPRARERLDVFLRICDAVRSRTHTESCTCDLKPANVMLGRFGEVLVMDWGVARILSGGDGAGESVAGTPGFMAPEQGHGADARVDARADVYALGVISQACCRRRCRGRWRRLQRAPVPTSIDRYPGCRPLAADILRFSERRAGDRLPRIARRAARAHVPPSRLPILLVVAYMIDAGRFCCSVAGRVTRRLAGRARLSRDVEMTR